jgi:hypothetical protein
MPAVPGHQLPDQEKKTPVKPAVELLKGPLTILRKNTGPEVKRRKQHHESGSEIDPQQQRNEKIENRLKARAPPVADAAFHIVRPDGYPSVFFRIKQVFTPPKAKIWIAAGPMGFYTNVVLWRTMAQR